MLRVRDLAFVGVSLLAIVNPALAQDAGNDTGYDSDEIVVSARRKDESAQDVPLVVNAVTSESLEKLNIRDFKDIQTLVPGLALGVSTNGIGTQAALRGVNYDVNASGNNGTIEFYLNDAPLSAQILFQTMFDVGQIEVLRGPQGTLRGRASPSGSITVTTRRPVLDSAGGYVNGTVNTIGGWNFNGAINVPIIQDKLAIRLAGVVEENDDNRVHSISNSLDPYQKNQAGRISIQFEPFDTLKLFASYTRSGRKVSSFDRVESLSVLDPAAPASPVTIRANDRLAVMAVPRTADQDFQVFNWQAEFRFAGQKLNYVGSRNKQKYVIYNLTDVGNFFGANYPAVLRQAAQTNVTRGKQVNHELRLSSDERLFGMFDYVVGALYNKLDVPTALVTRTPLFQGIFVPQGAFVPDPSRFLALINTPVVREGSQTEKSVFGNLTAHLGEATEISGGLRYIDFRSKGTLTIGGVPVAAANEDKKLNTTIYSASLKHRFNDDLMAYASFGTSWRPGSQTNSIIMREHVAPDALLSSFYFPPAEKSKSYEIGIKSEWLDKRLRLNITAYHQDFKNYAYSSRNVFVAGIDSSAVHRVITANPALAVGVPAKVDGVEAEIAFKVTPRWDIGATLSYAKSKISNGVIPCNDYFPHDGAPDSSSQVPTYAQIIAANGGAQIATCNVNYRAGSLAPFNATVRSEYSLPLSDKMDGYLRGLLTFNGKSQNDPANAVDDIGAYALLNLFAGLRDPDGAWELGFYGKNVLNTRRVLNRDVSALNVGYQQLYCTPQNPQIAAACPTGAITYGQSGTSTYRFINYTPPREFGVNLRIAFGSR